MSTEAKTYNYVGTRPIRHDGADKVTGRANYGADINLPGMLHGAIVRSPHAHARIVSIDTSAAAAMPGVKAVITGDDLPETSAKLAMGELQSLDHITVDKQAKRHVAPGAQMLEDLVSRQVLLEPLDADRQWYRFHHLLLDYLRLRLEERHAAEVSQLHRRAFGWYAEHELWTDAARHAIVSPPVSYEVYGKALLGVTRATLPSVNSTSACPSSPVASA